MAATRRGWVQASFPTERKPSSARYCVICVVFPLPVSPITISTWFSWTACNNKKFVHRTNYRRLKRWSGRESAKRTLCANKISILKTLRLSFPWEISKVQGGHHHHHHRRRRRSADQSTFCTYGFLIDLQNVVINPIHFSTFGGGPISGRVLCISLFTSRWAYN